MIQLLRNTKNLESKLLIKILNSLHNQVKKIAIFRFTVCKHLINIYIQQNLSKSVKYFFFPNLYLIFNISSLNSET